MVFTNTNIYVILCINPSKTYEYVEKGGLEINKQIFCSRDILPGTKVQVLVNGQWRSGKVIEIPEETRGAFHIECDEEIHGGGNFCKGRDIVLPVDGPRDLSGFLRLLQ